VEFIADLNRDGVPETNFGTQQTEGPCVVQWSDPADSDGDTLTDVETEIVSLDLVGNVMHIGEDPARTSEGLIEAQSTTTAFPADSFFDVFFELRIPGTAGPVRNQVPARLTATVQTIPPYFATYVAAEGILLYDGLGEHRGTLTSLSLAVYGPQQGLESTRHNLPGTTSGGDSGSDALAVALALAAAVPMLVVIPVSRLRRR